MAAVTVAGCTMCPDPHDYSGPVPNGSSPQNNFRARSNGILPIGAVQMPWPPIVKGAADGGRGVVARDQGSSRREPTLAEPGVEQTGGTEDSGKVEPVSVLVDHEADVPADAGGEAGSAGVVPVVGDLTDEAAAADDDASAPELPAGDSADTAGVPGNGPEAPVVGPKVEVPSLAETPGWRPRRGG